MSETAPTTVGGGESEQDNSSSANVISSLLAERGTGTADDEIETSSIEALNWSEADEEELQQQKQQAAAAAAAVAAGGIPKNDGPVEEKVGTSGGEETVGGGGNLSTSLLESINSSDETETSKKSVIENWASGVKDAVDRGEIEIDREDDEDESSTSECSEDEDGRREEDTEEVAGDEEDDEKTLNHDGNDPNKGIRKRRKLSNEGKRKRRYVNIVEGEGSVSGFDDRLSNAPVLDDGPIWNKGAKRYQFHENRRINQKLTFGVLLAVVLAIGLGLGNLVAVNECESEYKSTQIPSKAQDQVKTENMEPPGDTGSINFKTAESTGDLEQHGSSKMHQNEYMSSGELDEPSEDKQQPAKYESVQDEVKVNSQLEKDTHAFDASTPSMMKTEEPKEDLKDKYTKHMETLSRIVKTLDNLQQKIHNFENKTRQLGGVVMLKGMVPENEGSIDDPQEEESLLYDEEVHDPDSIWDRDDNVEGQTADSTGDAGEAEETKENDDLFVLELIDGIEETLEYVQSKEAEKSLQRFRDNIFAPSWSWLKSKNPRTVSKKELRDMYTIEGAVRIFKKQTEEFVRLEREKLREMKILGLAEERRPEDYSEEEKAEIRKRYDAFVKEYPFKEEVEKFVTQKIHEYLEKPKSAQDEDKYRYEDFESMMPPDKENSVSDVSDSENDLISNTVDSKVLESMDEEDWNFVKLLHYQEVQEQREKEKVVEEGRAVDHTFAKKLLLERLIQHIMETRDPDLQENNPESESQTSDQSLHPHDQVESASQEEITDASYSDPLYDLPPTTDESSELELTVDDSLNNFPQGQEDNGDLQSNEHEYLAERMIKESKRKEKKKKSRKFQGSEEDSFEGSGHNNKRKKSRGRKEKTGSEDSWKKHKSHGHESENEKENFDGKNDNYDRKHRNHKDNRHRRSTEKEYKDNKGNQDWKDYDYDDDDDHKKKRYTGNKDSSNTNNGNRMPFGDKAVNSKEQDTAWLQERVHSRESHSLNSREKNSMGSTEGRQSSQQTRQERNGMKQRNKTGKKPRNQENI